jgi:hypothetical protein
MTMKVFRTAAAAAGVAAALVAPAGAGAAVTQVFTGLASDPVHCTVQTRPAVAGQRWCTGAPSRVRSFDGTPIDVSVALPPAPASGPDGRFPLIGIYHGWGGSKALPSGGAAQHWLEEGYAVFSMTDRGWHESCGTPASRTALPAWATCANGDIRLMDLRYEVRDAQFLMGVLVDDGVVDPRRIGAAGGSYGGMASSSLGTLNGRTMLPDGRLVPWRSPHGTPLHIAAATPAALATDVLYTQQPNGSTLDYAAWTPYFGPKGTARVGVQKATVMNGFLHGAIVRGNPGAQMLALGAAANGPGPYDAMRPAIADALRTHGAYNVPDAQAPAPMLMSDGFSDDFATVDESVKLFNRIRTEHPRTPVAMDFGDLGHARSQDKAADAAELAAWQRDWMRYYVLRQGPRPAQGVRMRGITCPATAPSSGPFSFPDWSAISSGEVRLTTRRAQTIAASGGLYGDRFSAPTGSACATSPAADNPRTANYHVRAATGGGYDVSGSATLLLRLAVSGPGDQLAARLLDVAPDGQQTLVERGLLRPRVGAPKAVQVLQLHPNVWHVAPGHALKLELLPDDVPYSHLNPTAPDAAAQHPIRVRAVQLRVPVMQRARGSRGLVKRPLRRYLPPGYRAARDFLGDTTRVPQGFGAPHHRRR